MAAPRHIVDALESVLSLYFSNCRHKERAAFILCDELVEVTCREKVKLRHRNLGRIDFHSLVTHQEVGFNVNTPGLGKCILDSHTIRNDMQHNNPAATVDSQHCADTIVDAMEVIEHCFPGAKIALPDKIKVTLRVLRLFSQYGDPRQQTDFGYAMQRYQWRGTRERAKREELVVAPGPRANWGLVIPSEYARVEALLDRVGVPPFY
jgi:hypothetical protein